MMISREADACGVQYDRPILSRDIKLQANNCKSAIHVQNDVKFAKIG